MRLHGFELGTEGFDLFHEGVDFLGGRCGCVGTEVIGAWFGGLEKLGGSGSESGCGCLGF